MNEDAALLQDEWPLWKKFNLKPGDTVVVAGAYQGKVMELILNKFPGVMVIGFEPQSWAVERAYARLLRYDNWRLYSFGLGVVDGEFPMGEFFTDACSFVNTESREVGTGQLIEAGWVFGSYKLDLIDLFVCNMEGYEFSLIPHLKFYYPQIKAMAIQWHPDLALTYDDAKMNGIISDLSEHYDLVVDERPAWTYHESSRNSSPS